MTQPWVGLSLMPEDAFRVAAAPLFAAGTVDALEWSFDMSFHARLAPWLEGLLAHYAAAGRLFGHGVHYSPLSAVWEERQARWLDALTHELEARSYVHVSEHYGFMTAPPFQRGSPLPPPRCSAALALGRDRLRRLRERLDCPLGLENLALAWNHDEALAQGAVLDELLQHPDDFLVLDVHNLYCQMTNFGIAPDQLLASFPLARVREIHVSGGSWLGAWPGESRLVRCDTHDERVPAPVFELLHAALAACPNVRVVIFERLGSTLGSVPEAETFREDFQRVCAIVHEQRAPRSALAAAHAAAAVLAGSSLADERALAEFQSALLLALSRKDLNESGLRHVLAEDPSFAAFRADIDGFDASALGIAARVVQKWAR